jgi:nucleotide-binding universal stress UspA family protein
MIRDILVHVDPARDGRGPGDGRGPSDGRGPGIAADYALALAAQHEAHVRAYAFGFWAVPATAFADVPAGLIEDQQREAETRAAAVRAGFEEAARRAGVSFESHVLIGDSALAANALAVGARVSDLAVIAQDEPDSSGLRTVLIEAALFDGGRPVLIVPYIQRGEPAFRRVMIAWDYSRAAARALHDALPLLRKADVVEVVMVEKRRAADQDVPGADVGAHLARHGLRVDVHRVPGEDIAIAEAILSYASDAGADLLVMGGYEHSRLREFLLGGATRGVLEAMTIPVLMSH